MKQREMLMLGLLAAIIAFVMARKRDVIGAEATMIGKSISNAYTSVKNYVTGNSGISIVKDREGFYPYAYLDPLSLWTIGYGHLISSTDMKKYVPSTVLDKSYPQGKRGTYKMSAEEGEALLHKDLAYAEGVVKAAVKVPLTQAQFDSLVSFTFNVGPGAKGVKSGFVTLKDGSTSTILLKLNAGDYKGAAAELSKWTNQGMPGLVARRAMERTLFEGGTPV